MTHPKPGGPAAEPAPPPDQDRNDPGQPAAPEPSSEPQVDIADKVQKGLSDANARSDKGSNEDEDRATRPAGGGPAADARDGVFKPADDTPGTLPTGKGPRV